MAKKRWDLCLVSIQNTPNQSTPDIERYDTAIPRFEPWTHKEFVHEKSSLGLRY